MRDVIVAGVGLTPFTKYQAGIESWQYGTSAIGSALQDAGMEISDVQAMFSGGVYTEMSDGHRALGQLGMSGIPIVNVENACSSGSSAFRLAWQQVATGLCDVALANGTDVIPQKGFLASKAWPEWERRMGFNVQPANYALKTVRYMADTGATIEDISAVAVKNRRNGALNPNARFQSEVSLAEVLGSRMVADPLRLLHLAPLAQGAAAAILCSADRVRSSHRQVAVACSILTSGVYGAYGQTGDSVMIKRPNHIEMCAQQAWEASGLDPKDIQVAQAYDTAASSELWCLEYMGFCGKGDAPSLLRKGEFDLGGRLPVNTDGGLMARGHPMGASGLAQIIEIALQLQDRAGPRQVEGARVGLAQSLGAGPNCSITILKT